MITHVGQVKSFSLSQEQVLISGPCLQTLAHPLPCSPHLGSCCHRLSTLLPEGLLFTAECLLLSAVCDRAHQQTGLIVMRLWGQGREWREV